MFPVCRYADGAGSIDNNAMLRVFRNMDTYNEEGKPGRWIKAIVVNCCIDFAKRKNFPAYASNLKLH